MRFVDKVDLLEDNFKVLKNLDLTYAVRDGILSHCGEIDENGICMSENLNKQLKDIKDFNYENIYKHKRLEPFKDYAEVVITQIFKALEVLYDGEHTWKKLEDNRDFTPQLIESFESWLARYCDKEIVPKGSLQDLSLKCENEKIYNRLETKEIYIQAIIDYISGMTDRFAISVFNDLLQY